MRPALTRKVTMPKNNRVKPKVRTGKRSAGSHERLVSGRRWVIDEMVEMGDAHILELARDYGYGGDDPRRAAVALRGWLYRVRAH